MSLAPNRQPFSDLLEVDVATVKHVLECWRTGRIDSLLDMDGKAFRPDGKRAGTLLSAAFHLAGVNPHRYTRFDSVTCWNAHAVAKEIHRSETLFDARLLISIAHGSERA